MAGLKSYNLGGYRISNSGGTWRAVDPKTGKVEKSDHSETVVMEWAQANKKES